MDVTDDLLATLAVDGTRIREENAPIVVLTLSETAPFALYHNFVEYPACNPFIPGNDARFSNPDCYNSQYTSSLEDRKNYSNGPNYADSNVYGANLTLDWKADWGGLKSITAFRRVEVQSGQEVDNVPTFDGNIYQDYDTNQWSQEFQLSGKAWSDRLDYVVGAYYLNETGRQKFPIRTDFIEFTTGGEIDNDTFAIFGQASYQLTDALSLTAGVRWSEEKQALPAATADRLRSAPIPGADPGARRGGAPAARDPGCRRRPALAVLPGRRPAAAERRGRDHRQPALADGVARLQDHRRRAGLRLVHAGLQGRRLHDARVPADHPRRHHDRDRSRRRSSRRSIPRKRSSSRSASRASGSTAACG